MTFFNNNFKLLFKKRIFGRFQFMSFVLDFAMGRKEASRKLKLAKINKCKTQKQKQKLKRIGAKEEKRIERNIESECTRRETKMNETDN